MHYICIYIVLNKLNIWIKKELPYHENTVGYTSVKSN